MVMEKQDEEQLLTQSMAHLLTLFAAYSLVALKPDHSSPLLPSTSLKIRSAIDLLLARKEKGPVDQDGY